MRKNISVTNERVLTAMEQSENASKLIEKAMLYYLDFIETEHITREELENLNKKVCILSEKYTQTINMLNRIIEMLDMH